MKRFIAMACIAVSSVSFAKDTPTADQEAYCLGIAMSLYDTGREPLIKLYRDIFSYSSEYRYELTPSLAKYLDRGYADADNYIKGGGSIENAYAGFGEICGDVAMDGLETLSKENIPKYNEIVSEVKKIGAL